MGDTTLPTTRGFSPVLLWRNLLGWYRRRLVGDVGVRRLVGRRHLLTVWAPCAGRGFPAVAGYRLRSWFLTQVVRTRGFVLRLHLASLLLVRKAEPTRELEEQSA